MSKIMETGLLSVSHVKNKKCEGSLCIQSEQITWLSQRNDSLTISYCFDDVKMQKISADSKDKVQLQLVLLNGNSETFLFCNPRGKNFQLEDRNAVRDLIQRLLVDYNKQKDDLDEKTKMLQEDPNLFQLYTRLVGGKILSAEIFWEGKIIKSKVGENAKQDVGISAGFRADVKTGCRGEARYRLTVDIVDSIFSTYPEVKRKFEEIVPHRMTEKEFWDQFFNSAYCHKENDDGLFADCIKKDDIAYRKYIEANNDANQLYDSFQDHGESSLSQTSLPSKSSTLLQRLNQHSAMVLNAMDSTNIPAAFESCGPNGKRKRKLSEVDESCRPLKLNKIENYRLEPVPTPAVSYEKPHSHYAKIFANDIMTWKPTQIKLPAHSLSCFQNQGPHREPEANLPKELHLELKIVNACLIELVRMFWSCFPVTTQEHEVKLKQAVESLRKFREIEISTLTKKIDAYRLHFNPLNYINKLLDKAFDKFSCHQKKRKTNI